MSAGAQFAVRAAVNVTSDSLLNIGQQMALTGHVDWGEFAQGVAMSLVLHGSRRVQAFQARVTAVGARGVAGGVSRLGGGVEPSAASARASEFAAKMEQHAATAQKESKEPLDWTRPTRAPEPAAAPPPPESTGKATPSEATPPAPAETRLPRHLLTRRRRPPLPPKLLSHQNRWNPPRQKSLGSIPLRPRSMRRKQQLHQVQPLSRMLFRKSVRSPRAPRRLALTITKCMSVVAPKASKSGCVAVCVAH